MLMVLKFISTSESRLLDWIKDICFEVNSVSDRDGQRRQTFTGPKIFFVLYLWCNCEYFYWTNTSQRLGTGFAD